MRCEGHVVQAQEVRNPYKIVVKRKKERGDRFYKKVHEDASALVECNVLGYYAMKYLK